MNSFGWFGSTAALGIFLAACAGITTGAPVPFAIDPTRSSISLSGNVVVDQVGTFPMQPQGSGSLVASYHGTILVEISPPLIQFTGGSVIRAGTNGTWQPAPGGVSGSAPANYGGKITPPLTIGYSAGRNIQVDLVSSPALLTNGCFDASSLVVQFQTNAVPPPSMDFRVTSFLPGQNSNGSELLGGWTTNSPSLGYLTNSAGSLSLVLPVNTTNVSVMDGNQMTLVLTGQIVATAPVSAWPVIVTLNTIKDGQVTLTWPTVPGQQFEVQATRDVGTTWILAPGTLTQSSNTASWTSPTPDTLQFYRVRISK